VNAFRKECYSIINEILTTIITSIKRYFSGDTVTNTNGEIQKYIGNEVADSTNVIKTAMNDLLTVRSVDGSVSIYETTNGTFTIQPDIYVFNICLSGTTQPTLTLGSVSYPLVYTPMSVNTAGSVIRWQGTATINGTFDAPVRGTVSADNSVILFVQPQNSSQAGVA